MPPDSSVHGAAGAAIDFNRDAAYSDERALRMLTLAARYRFRQEWRKLSGGDCWWLDKSDAGAVFSAQLLLGLNTPISLMLASSAYNPLKVTSRRGSFLHNRLRERLV